MLLALQYGGKLRPDPGPPGRFAATRRAAPVGVLCDEGRATGLGAGSRAWTIARAWLELIDLPTGRRGQTLLSECVHGTLRLGKMNDLGSNHR
jgi:hypothetical protein